VKKQIIIITLALIAVFVSVSTVSAANLTVGSGQTYSNISSAYDAAADNGDTIFITDGQYSGSGNTNITINKNLTIQGQSQNGTIINGTGTNWIFHINPGCNVTIQNLTLTNGKRIDMGGAIQNNGNLTLTNCTFANNTAANGGAICNQRSSNMTVSDCTFIGNSGTSVGGGAIITFGSSYVSDSIFTNNTAAINGGAINIQSGGNLTVSGSTFNGNSAHSLGGIISSLGSANIIGNIFINNLSPYGGGIATRGFTPTVHFNRFYNNTAPIIDGLVDAENNWWGSNNPDFSSLINIASAPTQWLFMTINATPSTINNTQTTLITVSFNNYSTDGINYTPLPTPLAGHIPDGTPVTFSLTNGNFGTLTAPLTVNTIGGIASIVFTASQVGVQDVNATLDNQTVTTSITINPAANLFIKITSSKKNPKIGETFTITYKLGNNGPDAAENVTITIPLPEGFEISDISGDGKWTYNAATNTITWTLENVPVGDPYLYVSGLLNHAGTFVFISSISSDTYNINTQGVTPVTINAVEVKAASNTVGMHETGLPIIGLILAILAIFSGLLAPKRK
jgi:uncharacterized repeat protein (TIGR01451 family)